MEDILVADGRWYGATRLIGMIRVLFREKDLKSEYCGHHHQKPRSLEKTLGLLAKILSDGAVYAGSNISNKTSIKAKYSRFYPNLGSTLCTSQSAQVHFTRLRVDLRYQFALREDSELLGDN